VISLLLIGVFGRETRGRELSELESDQEERPLASHARLSS
jgi:hypothetical protein